jgi:hypothetical protein
LSRDVTTKSARSLLRLGQRGCQCHNSLPTPRTALRALVALLVWQRRCQHQAFADLEALVESGRGDVPLSHLKFLQKPTET